jgi:hypothetical protein
MIQVRELRGATSRKEKVLRRAATLLDEYTFSLEQVTHTHMSYVICHM